MQCKQVRIVTPGVSGDRFRRHQRVTACPTDRQFDAASSEVRSTWRAETCTFTVDGDRAAAQLPSRRDVLAGAATIAGAAALQRRDPADRVGPARDPRDEPAHHRLRSEGGRRDRRRQGARLRQRRHPHVQGHSVRRVHRGAARFARPSKPAPWAGVRSALYYGPTCPQGARTGWKNDEEAFVFEWDDGQPGEDCLRVNVWTPGLNDNKKRPVLVWIHGGQFLAGRARS